MTDQIFLDLFILILWAVMSLLCLIYEEELIEVEHIVLKEIKKYAYAFIRSVEACIAERKGNMFIIFKTPGQDPVPLHNIGNSFKAIHREIDSERPEHIEVIPGIYMCYDADGFAKSLAPCMTDERAENIIYGDVAFYALNSKENALRSLTPREAKLVSTYISTYRADKLN